MRQIIVAEWLVIAWPEPKPRCGGCILNIGHSRTYCQPSSIDVLIITSRLNKCYADFWGCALHLWFAHYRTVHIHRISQFTVTELKLEVVLLYQLFFMLRLCAWLLIEQENISLNTVCLILEVLKHAHFISSNELILKSALPLSLCSQSVSFIPNGFKCKMSGNHWSYQINSYFCILVSFLQKV